MALTKVIGAGAEGLTLSSTSLTIANGLTLTDGNVTLASGQGIDFAATSDASGQSSEILDNYEEGTWTPTYTGSGGNPTVTYDSTVHGHYTRIGRQVYCSGFIMTDAFSGGSGVLQVSGLPFSDGNLGGNSYHYAVGGSVVSNDFASNQPHSPMVVPGSTSFYLISGNYSALTISDCADGANKNAARFCVFYMTT
jgi:hypothetical protein